MLGDKKSKVTVSALFIIAMWGTLATTAYANSSWIWLTRGQPYELLPLAVLVTLVIETGEFNILSSSIFILVSGSKVFCWRNGDS